MMSNQIKFKDRMACQPGYYVKELMEESGLSQEDFARRIETDSKNLNLLMDGQQRLSLEMAVKLSLFLGTTVKYWLNIQQAFDELRAEFHLGVDVFSDGRSPSRN